MAFRLWRGKNTSVEKRGEDSIAAKINDTLNQVQIVGRPGNEYMVLGIVDSLKYYLSMPEVDTGLSPQESYNLHKRCAELFHALGQFRTPDLAYSEFTKAAEIALRNGLDRALLADVGQKIFDLVLSGEAESSLSDNARAKLCESLMARYKVRSDANTDRLHRFIYDYSTRIAQENVNSGIAGASIAVEHLQRAVMHADVAHRQGAELGLASARHNLNLAVLENASRKLDAVARETDSELPNRSKAFDYLRDVRKTLHGLEIGGEEFREAGRLLEVLKALPLTEAEKALLREEAKREAEKRRRLQKIAEEGWDDMQRRRYPG